LVSAEGSAVVNRRKGNSRMMQFSLTPEQIEIKKSVAKLMRDFPD
jgi:hypothetical protein